MAFDKHATKDSATETTEAMVKPLQETLSGRSEFRVSVVCNEGATGGPNSGMGDALNKLKREDKPGPSDEGDVNEADDVAQETQGQDFDVADLVDDLEAVKVGGHFRDVIENGGDAKESGGATIILQMPEEEGKDKPNADAHYPSHQHNPAMK